MAEWKERWEGLPRTRWDQIEQAPDKKVVQLHRKLKKAESSMLVQLRTGRIGLANFLNKARVPSYDTGMCQCNRGLETPRHLLVTCSLEEERRLELGPREGRNFVRLLTSPRSVLTTTKWAILAGRIRQFSVAASLLY